MSWSLKWKQRSLSVWSVRWIEYQIWLKEWHQYVSYIIPIFAFKAVQLSSLFQDTALRHRASGAQCPETAQWLDAWMWGHRTVSKRWATSTQWLSATSQKNEELIPVLSLVSSVCNGRDSHSWIHIFALYWYGLVGQETSKLNMTGKKTKCTLFILKNCSLYPR